MVTARMLLNRQKMATSSELQAPATHSESPQEYSNGANGVDNEIQEEHKPELLPGYLHWENDLEMMSKYLDRKEALEESHHQYLRNNPEVKSILADFLQALLIQKPDNVFQFARNFFTPFDPNAPHAPSYPSYKPPPSSEPPSSSAEDT